MKWNHCLRGLTSFVFNFSAEPLKQSVKLSWFVIFNFLGNPFSKHHFFQTDNQKAVLFTIFLLLELFFSCCIVVVLLKENLLKTLAIILRTNFQHIQMLQSKAHIWLAICEFFWLLTNQNVWFVSCSHWINLFCIELPENCYYLDQSELSNFFILLISVQHFCHAKRILSQSVPWNAQIKIIQFFLWLFKYETSDTTNG